MWILQTSQCDFKKKILPLTNEHYRVTKYCGDMVFYRFYNRGDALAMRRRARWACHSGECLRAANQTSDVRSVGVSAPPTQPCPSCSTLLFTQKSDRRVFTEVPFTLLTKCVYKTLTATGSPFNSILFLFLTYSASFGRLKWVPVVLWPCEVVQTRGQQGTVSKFTALLEERGRIFFEPVPGRVSWGTAVMYS